MTTFERLTIRCLRMILWVLFGKTGLYNMKEYKDLQKDIDEFMEGEKNE